MPTPTADPNADPSLNGGEGGGDGGSQTPSGQGSDPAMQEAALKEINRISGRTFTNLEEAQKHIQGLNSLVGNPRLREDAQLLDSFTKRLAEEQGITPEEARTRLKEAAGAAPRTNDRQPPATSSADTERLERLERSDFLRNNPTAEKHVDAVAKFAKANNISLDVAFSELYGEVFKQQDEQKKQEAGRQEKMAATVNVNESSAPNAPAGSQEEKALKMYRDTGNDQYLNEAIRLRDARTAAARSNR
jgi:hypothetical protein